MEFNLPPPDPISKKPPRKTKQPPGAHSRDNPHVVSTGHKGDSEVIIFRFHPRVIADAQKLADKLGISVGSWYETRLREFIDAVQDASSGD